MKWRKYAAGCLAAVLACGLAACGQGEQKQMVSKNLMQEVEYSENLEKLSPKNWNEEEMQVQVTDFAVRLFQNTFLKAQEAQGEETSNVLISPISVFTGLSMTANGAAGETLAQMEQVLGMEVENLNLYATNHLTKLSEEENPKLLMANAVWFLDDAELFTVEKAFLQKNQQYYHADIYQSAFDESTVKDINLWVNEKTEEMIPEIIREISPDTVMYLVNALAFDAQWEEVYRSSDVSNGTFYARGSSAQEAKMLISEEHVYLEDAYAEGFLKYYEDKNYAFAALLPKEGISLQEYITALSGSHIQKLLAEAKEILVHASIPKFEVEYEIEMSEPLKAMGMIDAFGEADFRGIGSSTQGNLFINAILHKTFLSLDELGTKAGAVTAVEINAESAVEEQESKTVILDRPFLYMIIDCESNQPVFFGSIEYIQDMEKGQK